LPKAADARAVVERLTDAWNRHDAEGVAACYAADAVSREVALTEPLRGRQAIRNSAQMYMDAMPDIRLETRRVFAEGDCVCEEWTVTATHAGDMLGLTPTGRRIEVALCRVMTVDDHRLIRSETTYWDSLGLYRQLGALPALGPTSGLSEGELSAEWG
jgi:steroid delta-isomerase-like uncharacterized protein